MGKIAELLVRGVLGATEIVKRGIELEKEKEKRSRAHSAPPRHDWMSEIRDDMELFISDNSDRTVDDVSIELEALINRTIDKAYQGANKEIKQKNPHLKWE